MEYKKGKFHMKKHSRTILCGLAILCVLSITIFAASYDSSEDPLISLSYLTNIFRPSIEKELEEEVERLESMIKQLTNGGNSSSTDGVLEEKVEQLEYKIRQLSSTLAEYEERLSEIDTSQGTEAGYEVLELKKGDCLYAASACDIMLRSGSAVCIAPDPTQGLADYTDAREIYNGENLTKNHKCLIPRADGRGIKATADSVYIIIRGDYTIVYAE